MTDTKTTLTWVLKDEVSGTAKGIGASLGGLVNPMTLAIGAAAGLGAALVGAVKAAADEQINIEKLNASLVANVEGFNGNTAAIEELISQREMLGFSDDEQRASLALLLAGTHDVTKAQELQSLAMDLARLKSVDLETATNAIAKANAGSTRELKALGIEVTDNMTKAEALAAVQAAAAGQAAAYGDTLAGKWDALQIKFGDLMEDIGAGLIGPLTGLADFVIDTIVPAMQDFGQAVGPAMHDAFQTMGAGVKELMKLLGPLLDMINNLIDAAGGLGAVLGQVAGMISPTGSLAAQMQSQILASTAKVSTYIGKLPPRAGGGSVEAGGAYLVGEQGPEMLVMGNQSGSIIPGGGGGAPVVLPIIIDGQEIARVVDERLYLAIRRASPSTGRA